MNEELCIKVGTWNNSILWCTVEEISNYKRIIVFAYVEINSITYFRPFRHGGKRTLYLVDTVAMVAQQASYIRHLTDLSVGEYTSVDTVDMFDTEDWEQQFQGNQVDVTSLCIVLQQGYSLHSVWLSAKSNMAEITVKLNITLPTNALIVCRLFQITFLKHFSLLLHVLIAYRLSSSGSTHSS